MLVLVVSKEVIFTKYSAYLSHEFYLSKENWEMLSWCLFYVCMHIGNSYKISVLLQKGAQTLSLSVKEILPHDFI